MAGWAKPHCSLQLTGLGLTSNSQCDGNNRPEHIDGGAGFAGRAKADSEEVPGVNAAAATLAARLDPEKLHAGTVASPLGALVLVASIRRWKRLLDAVGLVVDRARFESVAVDKTSLLALRAQAAMTWTSHRNGCESRPTQVGSIPLPLCALLILMRLRLPKVW